MTDQATEKSLEAPPAPGQVEPKPLVDMRQPGDVSSNPDKIAGLELPNLFLDPKGDDPIAHPRKLGPGVARQEGVVERSATKEIVEKTTALDPKAAQDKEFFDWLNAEMQAEAMAPAKKAEVPVKKTEEPAKKVDGPANQAEEPAKKAEVPASKTDASDPKTDGVGTKTEVAKPSMKNHYDDAASGVAAAVENEKPIVFVVGSHMNCGPCRDLEGIKVLKVDKKNRPVEISAPDPNSFWLKFGADNNGKVATFNIDIERLKNGSATALEQKLAGHVESWPTAIVAIPVRDGSGKVIGMKQVAEYIGPAITSSLKTKVAEVLNSQPQPQPRASRTR